MAKARSRSPRSSPDARQRGGDGAELDGGDRSATKRAVPRAVHMQRYRRHGSDQLFAYVTERHRLDGRDLSASRIAHMVERASSRLKGATFLKLERRASA